MTEVSNSTILGAAAEHPLTTADDLKPNHEKQNESVLVATLLNWEN